MSEQASIDSIARLEGKRALYVDACAAVVALASQISQTFQVLSTIHKGMGERMLESQLENANTFMQGLGDLISNNDLVDPDAEPDEWLDKVYSRMRNWKLEQHGIKAE